MTTEKQFKKCGQLTSDILDLLIDFNGENIPEQIRDKITLEILTALNKCDDYIFEYYHDFIIEKLREKSQKAVKKIFEKTGEN